jgi:hypothetical protein
VNPVELVAVLSGEDSGAWGRNSEGGVQDRVSARVTADGSRLVFMSDRSLTGYDNRDAHSGRPDEEVYLYTGGTGGPAGLVCVSCDPTGARPVGVEYEKINGGVAGGSNVWPDTAVIAGSVPGWTPFSLGEALYQSRYLDASGRVFFNSSDGLVPTDRNGTEDVYEYEPPGVGSCTTSSVTFSTASGGCVDLISSGTSGEESGFLDASESGDDVFFLTAAQLSKHDTDTSLDVYDARVGGGPGPEPPQPVECVGDACQNPVEPPEDQTPGSLTYKGPGNPLFSPAPGMAVKPKTKPLARAQLLTKALKACRGDRNRAKRTKCEKKARRAYGSARKASNAGRAGR